MKKATLAGIAGVAMFTSLSVAQEVHVFGGEAQTFEFRTISDAEGFGVGKVVTGLPFSADETTTTTQVLADGNRIVNRSTSKVYRDAQGRTRTENTLGNIGALPASEARVSIMINDPVAGTHYVVSPNEHSFFKMEAAHQVASDQMVMKMADEAKAKARTEAGNTSTLTYSTMARHSIEKSAKTEDLGNQNMEGVLVKGTRTTTTIAAGSMGNDRDINIVMERWYSPELQMNIMTKRTDPRMGETVFQVTNLSRSNPDPSLFVPPADYQLKDGMKGAAFTKAVTIQK
jgi:hypothetical protein